MAKASSASPPGTLPGATAFRLYDTYGFPLDLTQDALRARGMTVDLAGFDAAMERQRAEARKSWAGSGEAATETLWFELKEELGATEFLGYETETAEGQIVALVAGAEETGAAATGAKVQIVVNQTPFYAEAGGQVGDSGLIRTDTGLATVTDTKKSAGVFIHVAVVTEGEIARGQPAGASVSSGVS